MTNQLLIKQGHTENVLRVFEIMKLRYGTWIIQKIYIHGSIKYCRKRENLPPKKTVEDKKRSGGTRIKGHNINTTPLSPTTVKTLPLLIEAHHIKS